jgi:catechol 2,3-dioxygenase-like lactoylglutathione lyase family enzyme
LDEVKLSHIGIECINQEKVITFFTKICGLNFLKSYELNEQLSEKIFSINKSINILVFHNQNTYIEVFLTSHKKTDSFNHICLEVPNKNRFIEKCIQFGLQPFKVLKNGKELLFVRDFSNNIYEIKEM